MHTWWFGEVSLILFFIICIELPLRIESSTRWFHIISPPIAGARLLTAAVACGTAAAVVLSILNSGDIWMIYWRICWETTRFLCAGSRRNDNVLFDAKLGRIYYGDREQASGQRSAHTVRLFGECQYRIDKRYAENNRCRPSTSQVFCFLFMRENLWFCYDR